MNITNLKVSETSDKYVLNTELSSEEIIRLAIELAQNKLKKGMQFNCPQAVYDYLQILYMAHEEEVFTMIFLDSQHRVITHKELFKGTIDSASVYPRVIVKEVLKHNAAKVIISHNHPSGIPTPSNADIQFTKKIQSALNLIDVAVLDHVVVASEGTCSFKERGLI
ncbi:DNA repair protein RadC [uncultured Pseudoalteromonas sp.]|uniref:RadC family protein n=1 Tax=uncultured Pseudoalteromonas sp. TaxID=114053 RepID=UPI002592E97F|nr:DNA repair protein RadC [uncultured Pseudoalteromonas sp.]